jgi:glycosyltransferase involved in cell wall biosynthesis
MGETFLQTYRCKPQNVEVIEHGLDLSRFDPQRADGDRVRRELGLSEKLVLGAISKHFWVKNLDALVKGFADVAAQHPEAHLVILGAGDSSGLQDVVRDFQLGEHVSVIPRRHDVPDVIAAFDVFVHPALAESFGFAILEAMAMRRPVATTPVGIARDILEDGVSGIEIAGTDPSSLRDGMLKAIAIRDRWSEIGEEARRRAMWFTPERWVRRHEELYLRRLGLEPSETDLPTETPREGAEATGDEHSAGPPVAPA